MFPSLKALFRSLNYCLVTFFVSCVTFPLPKVQAWELPVYNSGEKFDSEKYPEQLKLLEFYFNGCHYCNENAPKVSEMAKSHPNVVVVDVSVDCEKEEYEAWISKHHPSWPILNACSSVVPDLYDVASYPTTVILGRKGEILYRASGVWSASKKEKIRKILEEN